MGLRIESMFCAEPFVCMSAGHIAHMLLLLQGVTTDADGAVREYLGCQARPVGN